MSIEREPGEYRLLTLTDVAPAADVLAQAFVEDPLCAFMLPLKRTRVRKLHSFFRAYGEVNIQNRRGYGAGEPLQGVAYWKFPDQDDLSPVVSTPLFLVSRFFLCYTAQAEVIRHPAVIE